MLTIAGSMELWPRSSARMREMRRMADEPGDAVGGSEEQFSGLLGDQVGRRSGGGEAMVEHGAPEFVGNLTSAQHERPCCACLHDARTATCGRRGLTSKPSAIS